MQIYSSSKINSLFQSIALGIAASAVMFMLVTSGMMLLECRNIGKTGIPDSSSLNELRLKYTSDAKGNTQIRGKIRQLDLQMRKIWFSSQERLKIGNWFLLTGALIFLGALKIFKVNTTEHFTQPPCPGIRSPLLVLAKIRKAITIAGFSVILLSIMVVGVSYYAGQIKRSNIASPSHDKEDFIVDDGDSWTGFRGNLTYGIATQNQIPPLWDGKTSKGVLWKADIPLPGYSSPVVRGHKVFLTGGNNLFRKVFCFDAGTGKLSWEHDTRNISDSPGNLPKVSEDTGYAASSMSVDKTNVYAIFATGDLVCLDYNGKKIWAKNLGVPANSYGYSSSLRSANGMLIIQYDDENKQRLIALNGKDGRLIWETVRQSAVSWSSPIIVTVGNRLIIVVVSSEGVEAFDINNGKVLWRMIGMGGEVATSAAFSNGRIFVSNDNACTVALNAMDGAVLWKSTELTMPDVSSPLAVDELLFLFSSHGVIQCVDAKTGKMLWEKESGTGFYSSPLLIGNKIIAFNLEGTAVIIQPSREKYIEVAVCELGEKTFSTPAFAGRKLFIRTNKFLYAIGSPQ